MSNSNKTQSKSQHNEENIEWINNLAISLNLKSFSRLIQAIFCIVGIYSTYMYYAILQERISFFEYEKDGVIERFKYHNFLMFIQCIVNAIWAGIAVKITKGKLFDNTEGSIAIISITYLLGMATSYAALSFINYPTTVLVKSCKMIPVMIMSIIIGGKSYKLSQFALMLLVTTGISLFMYAKDKSSDDGKVSSLYGVILAIASLLMDGTTGARQDALIAKVSISSHKLMFGVNFWATIFVGIYVLITGEFTKAIEFGTRHQDIWYPIINFCIVSALGQNFIFMTVRVFGALTLALITTTRKFFTILASLIVFGHPITITQIIGILLVFVGLGGELIDKYKSKQKQH
eukprot:TRINITY_DN5031_c0_g1_i1.p1 TRINITY_DN5031_c0_g1~~TRINITY_DN5031_c0_g1_i1.p1  ORF type:complete len:347 (+),score=125.97 TRINITY_DN5031_c0_g1_i1:52-1092(+)